MDRPHCSAHNHLHSPEPRNRPAPCVTPRVGESYTAASAPTHPISDHPTPPHTDLACRARHPSQCPSPPPHLQSAPGTDSASARTDWISLRVHAQWRLTPPSRRRHPGQTIFQHHQCEALPGHAQPHAPTQPGVQFLALGSGMPPCVFRQHSTLLSMSLPCLPSLPSPLQSAHLHPPLQPAASHLELIGVHRLEGKRLDIPLEERFKRLVPAHQGLQIVQEIKPCVSSRACRRMRSRGPALHYHQPSAPWQV